MYQVIVKTKEKTYEIKVENLNDDRLIELIEQNKIIKLQIERVKTKEELIKERDSLLYNVVGMSYNTQKALELNKKIKED